MTTPSPFALLILVAACVPKTNSVGASEPLPPSAPAFDLSGDWTMGTGEEPADPVVTVTRRCGETVTKWRVYQAGERLGAVLVLGTPLQGVPHELPLEETARGTVEGDVVELESIVGVTAQSTTPWRLRYEATPRRLRGTRDGLAVWLAPLRVEEPDDCSDSLAKPVPFRLEGAWLVGKGSPEPRATVLVEHRECTHHPARWTLIQRGDRVESWYWPERFDQGIVTRDLVPVRRAPQTSGTLSGYELSLDGESRYRLRYDPESGHLHGTEDGVAVWAVKRQFIPPGPCAAVP